MNIHQNHIGQQRGGLLNHILARRCFADYLGVVLALLIATAGGLWLTQTALTPLRLMIDVCRRIAAGDLSQRVNLPQRSDEAGQVASAFDEMIARLDEAFTAQRQFVADASHELRTPLTAISGSLDVLLMAPEGDPETSRRVLHGMRREVQRLTRRSGCNARGSSGCIVCCASRVVSSDSWRFRTLCGWCGRGGGWLDSRVVGWSRGRIVGLSDGRMIACYFHRSYCAAAGCLIRSKSGAYTPV